MLGTLALGSAKNKQAREALRIGGDERDKNHSNSPQTFRREMVCYWNPHLNGSNSITEILAWFNLDGFVFEIMPFMNKNLFEILIQRDFKPFDVRFLFPATSLADHHAPSSSPTDGFLSRKNAQLWYHPHGHQARYPPLLPFYPENVMFYPLDDGRPVDSATVPVRLFSLSL